MNKSIILVLVTMLLLVVYRNYKHVPLKETSYGVSDVYNRGYNPGLTEGMSGNPGSLIQLSSTGPFTTYLRPVNQRGTFFYHPSWYRV